MCQKFLLMGVYGTSKLPIFYRNDFKRDLYCCICWWFEMSVYNPFDYTHYLPVNINSVPEEST